MVRDKSFKFATRIVKLYKFLKEDKKEYTPSKQLLTKCYKYKCYGQRSRTGRNKKEFCS